MSRNRLLFTALLSLVAIGSLLLFQTEMDVWAQRGGGGTTGQGFQYVVKFYCGEVTDVDAAGIDTLDRYGQFLAPGEYYTVINIHNPNEDIANYGKDWFKKVVLDYYVLQTGTDSEGVNRPRYVAQKPGIGEINQVFFINQDSLGNTIGTPEPPRTPIRDFTLSRDEAAQANCHELREVTQSIDSSFDDDDLIKGFVTIYSKVQLDITAIYTACDQGTIGALDCQTGGSTGVTTMEVVRIKPNGITPPAGLGLEESARFQNTSFPTTTSNKDCPAGGCQYIVKFVCGEIQGPETTIGIHTVESDLSPGEYYTDINIHNPNPKTINIKKKFTADDPVPEVHGPLTSPVQVTLLPDDAIEINCRDIRESALGRPFPATLFLKGFVVIFSRQQLDIVSVITACPNDRTAGNGELSCDGVDDVKTLDVRYLLPKDFSPVAPPAAFLPTAVAGVGASGEFKLTMQGLRLAVPLESAQLQVFNLGGQMLHDSGMVRDTTLSWRPLMNGRPLANGVYLYVVTTQDVLGNVTRQVGKFVYLRHR